LVEARPRMVRDARWWPQRQQCRWPSWGRGRTLSVRRGRHPDERQPNENGSEGEKKHVTMRISPSGIPAATVLFSSPRLYATMTELSVFFDTCRECAPSITPGPSFSVKQ
jgi:hypothetical protein